MTRFKADLGVEPKRSRKIAAILARREKHKVILVQIISQSRGPQGWRVECSCGAVGLIRSSSTEALWEGDRHQLP